MVPVLGPRCYACGNQTRATSAPTIAPVFRPEIQYLKKATAPDIGSYMQEIVTWANYTNYQYYCHGRPVLKMKRGAPGSDEMEWAIVGQKSGLPKKTRMNLLENLRKANAPYIEKLQYEAENFIRETATRYRGKTIIVSFSGGKDSTVVSHLVMNALGRPDVLHMFADTTIEFPDTYKYIREFQKQHPLTPFATVRSSLDFFETAKRIGPPSRILRWCCTTHKTNPLAKFINSIDPGNGVLAYDGIRKAESPRRNDYPRISNQHKIQRETLARPIIDWSDFETWVYILYHGLIFNHAYKKGFRRVGCLYCPFNSDWSFKMSEVRYPKKNQKWHAFLLLQAQKMEHPNPKAFASHGWRTRAGGQGLDHYKTAIEAAPCALSDNAISYQILSGEIKSVRHFLRPFGPQSIIKSNGHSEVFFIHDKQSLTILASVEISYKDKIVRINYLLEKNHYLFQQRIEKQLRKMQSCIACGLCESICPVNAITYDGSFTINANGCISCLNCVSLDCPIVKSLHFKGHKINGRV
jgi:phosphoadenosine phosphosulfate reductase